MTDTTTSDPDKIMCSLAPNWWTFMLRGALALIIAVLALAMPSEAVLALTLVFGAFSFADGIFGLWSGIRNIRKGERWGWLVVSGILGIATGLIVLILPFVATFVVAVFLWIMIAFWSIASGIFEIAAAIRLRREIKGEWLLMLSGLISVVLGVAVTWFLLTNPVASLLALGWLLGLYAAIFGVTLLLFGWKLRRLDRQGSSDGEPAGLKDEDAATA